MAGIAELVMDAAQAQGVDPRLALELAVQESGLNPNARGAAGEIGVMQLTSATAAELGVDPFDLAQNLQGGVRYLRRQLDRFGTPAAALAAYNWGPERVAQAIARWGSPWLAHAPGSTQAYVSAILARVGSAYSVSVSPTEIARALTSPGAPQIVQQMVRQAATPATLSRVLIVLAAAIGLDLLADFLD